MHKIIKALCLFYFFAIYTTQAQIWVKYENGDISTQFPKKPFDTTMSVGKNAIILVGVNEVAENYSITGTHMASNENFTKKSANEFYKDMLNGIISRAKGTNIVSKIIESGDGHQAVDASYIFQADGKTYKANNIFVLTDNDMIYRFMHVFLAENESKLKQNNSLFFDSIQFKKKFELH